MFKHILLAIDGSAYSRLSLPAAVEVAKKFDAEILVLHVSEHDRGRAVVFSHESPAAATMLVGNTVKTARDAGVKAEGQLRDVAAGHVARAIVETAQANGIELIVMGSRGLSDVQGLLLGSVTHEVMKAASIPVLVVKPAQTKARVASGSVASF
jgi:nucleotide-binding universal stress UspA family protein